MIQNRTEAAEIVDPWAEQIKLALPSRKLFYLYVANDVLQKSRKSEFPAEFAKVMPTVLQGVFSHTGPEVKLKVKKILNIWRVRDVYCEAYLEYWESMAGLDGLQNVHSTDGASPDEDEIEAETKPKLLFDRFSLNQFRTPKEKIYFDINKRLIDQTSESLLQDSEREMKTEENEAQFNPFQSEGIQNRRIKRSFNIK